jgi:hypothetical protein
MPGPKKQGLAVAALIIAVFLLLVISANIAPYDRQCGWVFPKILSCLLSARETLVAGLAAAGGALFAAWLAFAGLQDQIGMARRNELEAKRLDREKRVQVAGRDLELMKIAHGFVQSLTAEFPQADDASVSDLAFASRLLDLRHRGSLHISLNAVRAPDGNGDSIATVMGRLKILAGDLNEETKSLSAEMLPAILRNREEEVRTQIRHLRDLENILAGKIPRYDDKFQKAAAQKIE